MFLMAFENKAGLPVDPATFQLYVPALSALWGDSGIREAFSRRSEFQLVSEPSPGPHRLRPRGIPLYKPRKHKRTVNCSKS